VVLAASSEAVLSGITTVSDYASFMFLMIMDLKAILKPCMMQV